MARILFIKLVPILIHNLHNDIVHCEWNEWVTGECDKSCGGGTRAKTRTEKISAKHEGEQCPGPTSLPNISCNVQECPGKTMLLAVVNYGQIIRPIFMCETLAKLHNLSSSQWWMGRLVRVGTVLS